ncbi:MAG: DNA adenine methylase [Bacteroidia bacterium]
MIPIIEDNTIEATKIPHLLKYMGSKREIISFVKESIEKLDIESLWLCDLFTGTGVVAGSLKERYNIHANDIQSYSSILANTYLSNIKDSIDEQKILVIKEQVETLVNQFRLEYSSLVFNYQSVKTIEDFNNLEKSQQCLIGEEFKIGFHLFTKFYSGTYWSFEQCIWIDSIRAVAEKYINKSEYYFIISSLIFAMSYTSQSTGHYAQYRDANSESSMQDIMLYRKRDFWPYFERKFIELTTTLVPNKRPFKVTTLDYVDCLRIIENGTIIYADPPYQAVHYSRFYHVLETLVKYDYPKVLHKGRYRDDRHQSPFCKKTTVKDAFIRLFEGIRFKNAHLVLSYSDTGMISLEELELLYSKVLEKKYSIDILEIDHKHSKMGRNDEKEQDVKEYTLLFKCN